VNDAGSSGGAPGSSSGCSCGIGRHRSAAGSWWWMAALFSFGLPPWRRRTQRAP
jgi:hypothetical protein